MATTIDSLEIEIEATSTAAVQKLEALSQALEEIKNAVSGGLRLAAANRNLGNLRDILNSIDASRVGTLRDLASALNGLGNIQRSPGLQPTINSLQQLSNLNLSGFSSSSFQGVAQALNSLGSIQRASGLTSSINALRQIPRITQELDTATLNQFAQVIQRVTAAMEPLARMIQQMANGLRGLSPFIRQLIRDNQRLRDSLNNSDRSINNTVRSLRNWALALISVREAFGYIKQAITESNNYVENLNLFTVSMGDASEAALEYAETVKNALGIDPSEWIRNQGVFKQITSGFGVVEEQANLMSKNLTQLGYDKRLSLCEVIRIEKQGEPINIGCAA